MVKYRRRDIGRRIKCLTLEDKLFLHEFYKRKSWPGIAADQPNYCLRREDCYVSHPCIPCHNVLETVIDWENGYINEQANIEIHGEIEEITEKIKSVHRERRIRGS